MGTTQYPCVSLNPYPCPMTYLFFLSMYSCFFTLPINDAESEEVEKVKSLKWCSTELGQRTSFTPHTCISQPLIRRCTFMLCINN